MGRESVYMQDTPSYAATVVVPTFKCNFDVAILHPAVYN